MARMNCDGGSQYVEHRAQEAVHFYHLCRAYPPNAISDGLLDVDGAQLVQHDAGLPATYGDLWSEDVGMGARGCRCDDGGGEIQVIGLQDHRVARALLLVSDRVARRAQLVGVAAMPFSLQIRLRIVYKSL